ncbi:MAG TPA: hypothetical protein VM285_03805 [Polyangia bacterium]|nr:hypothetical protein [Polyangia bacterium]
MMHKTLALALAGVLASAALAHCGGRRGGASTIQGQVLFAQANLALSRGVLSVINYRQGDPLPIGTRITVTAASPKRIVFTVEGNPAPRTFVNHRSSGVDIGTAFLKFFGPEDPATRLAALPEQEREMVRRALPAPGMSKATVLLAIGPPPAAKNPSLDGPVWIYWNTRYTMFSVHFDAQGIVTQVAGHIDGATPVALPAAPAATAAATAPAEVLHARCNVRHDEGTVSWVNYRGTGVVIAVGTRVEVLDRSQKSVTFRDIETKYEYEFRNDDGESGKPTWDLFLRMFAPEDQTPRLEALAEKERKRVLGNEVVAGMSKTAVEMAWCPPPPHGTASLEAGTWIYWTNRVNRVKVHFDDSDRVTRVEQ